jgi:hypothetical protein
MTISHRDYVEYTNSNSMITFTELTLKSDYLSKINPFKNTFDKSLKVPYLEIMERQNFERGE